MLNTKTVLLPLPSLIYPTVQSARYNIDQGSATQGSRAACVSFPPLLGLPVTLKNKE